MAASPDGRWANGIRRGLAIARRDLRAGIVRRIQIWSMYPQSHLDMDEMLFDIGVMASDASQLSLRVGVNWGEVGQLGPSRQGGGREDAPFSELSPPIHPYPK